jgi:rubrerythrin
MEGAAMKKPELSTPDRILEVALAKEKEAREFYDEQATRCRVDFVRKLLEKLRDEEARHIRMVEGMMTKLIVGRDFV